MNTFVSLTEREAKSNQQKREESALFLSIHEITQYLAYNNNHLSLSKCKLSLYLNNILFHRPHEFYSNLAPQYFFTHTQIFRLVKIVVSMTVPSARTFRRRCVKYISRNLAIFTSPGYIFVEGLSV